MWIVDGLPLHPLIVHAPVVLIPLVAAGVVLQLLVPGWRRLIGPILVVMAVGAAITAVAAVSSGETLGEALRRGDELDAHRTFGERARLFAVLLAMGTIALVLYERRPYRVEARVVGGTAAVAALALASVTSVALTGHSGAQLAWANKLPPSQVATSGSTTVAAEVVSTPTSSPPPGEAGIDVSLGEWALVASTLEAPPGPTTFRFRNAGTVTHALRIRTPGSGSDRLEWRSEEVAPGETGTLVADLSAGTFELTCPIEDALGEHDALGMEGTLTVSPDAPAPATPPAAAAPATPGEVTISRFAFAPAEITVPVGADVMWTNSDPTPHTATGDGWETGQLAGGATAAIRFDRAGRFEYFCAIHPAMTGTVVVQ